MNKSFRFVRAASQKARSFVSAKTAAVGAALIVPAVSFAQAVDPFTTAASDIKTKVATYGAELVVIAAVGVVFMVGIKYVKKISRAA